MSSTTEDDLYAMPEAKLVARPLPNAVLGNLSRRWSRHSAMLHRRDEEPALNLTAERGPAGDMAADRVPSAVPAFTAAARNLTPKTAGKSADGEAGTRTAEMKHQAIRAKGEGENRRAPRPSVQRSLKL